MFPEIFMAKVYLQRGALTKEERYCLSLSMSSHMHEVYMWILPSSGVELRRRCRSNIHPERKRRKLITQLARA